MATFEGELEISFSSGPMSPPTAVAQDGGVAENASSSSSSTSSFLSNLFDPSIVDPSYTTSTDVPKFAPPSVILIEEIDSDNGTVQIVDENDGGGADEIDRVRYEHDVYFVLVVVTVSLTVLVMVTFAIYRIVENVMEGGGGQREDRGRRRGGRGGEVTSSTPPRATHPSVVGSSPQGHVGRAHSVEFLSGESMKTPPQVRCIDRVTERKSVHSIDRRLPLPSFSLSVWQMSRI